MKTIRSGGLRQQRGVATLLIALVLLAILTVITIFATNYGLFEQRTSGNEYRYKLAFQAAEAGLNQGMEYLKVNTGQIVSKTPGGWLPPATTARWEPCTTAAAAGMAYDPCSAESNGTIRNHLYRYVGASDGVLPLSDVLPSGSQTFTTTGGAAGFTTTYKTYATLCRLDMSAGGPPQCSTAPSEEGTFYVTLISKAGLDDENSNASVKASYAAYRLLGRVPDAPLIAAGTSIGLGSAELVPNPDAAGFGVPISIWAKGNADIAAADFATCQLGEWLTSDTPEDEVNGVCSKCTCTSLRRGYGFLSGKTKDAGGSVVRVEGLDILDVEPASGGDINVDGATNSHGFPDDLFLYVFGIPSSGADAYLAANASEITDCNSLTAASSGLYWYKGTADCSISNTGSLSAPVVLVSDAPVTMNANSTFYGIIFVRDDKISAGSDFLKATGTPQVYGSVILEGSAKISGSPGIIYNRAVLQNIFSSPKFTRYGPVPGSWSDTVD